MVDFLDGVPFTEDLFGDADYEKFKSLIEAQPSAVGTYPGEDLLMLIGDIINWEEKFRISNIGIEAVAHELGWSQLPQPEVVGLVPEKTFDEAAQETGESNAAATLAQSEQESAEAAEQLRVDHDERTREQKESDKQKKENNKKVHGETYGDLSEEVVGKREPVENAIAIADEVGTKINAYIYEKMGPTWWVAASYQCTVTAVDPVAKLCTVTVPSFPVPIEGCEYGSSPPTIGGKYILAVPVIVPDDPAQLPVVPAPAGRMWIKSSGVLTLWYSRLDGARTTICHVPWPPTEKEVEPEDEFTLEFFADFVGVDGEGAVWVDSGDLDHTLYRYEKNEAGIWDVTASLGTPSSMRPRAVDSTPGLSRPMAQEQTSSGSFAVQHTQNRPPVSFTYVPGCDGGPPMFNPHDAICVAYWIVGCILHQTAYVHADQISRMLSGNDSLAAWNPGGTVFLNGEPIYEEGMIRGIYVLPGEPVPFSYLQSTIWGHWIRADAPTYAAVADTLTHGFAPDFPWGHGVFTYALGDKLFYYSLNDGWCWSDPATEFEPARFHAVIPFGRYTDPEWIANPPDPEEPGRIPSFPVAPAVLAFQDEGGAILDVGGDPGRGPTSVLGVGPAGKNDLGQDLGMRIIALWDNNWGVPGAVESSFSLAARWGDGTPWNTFPTGSLPHSVVADALKLQAQDQGLENLLIQSGLDAFMYTEHAGSEEEEWHEVAWANPIYLPGCNLTISAGRRAYLV